MVLASQKYNNLIRSVSGSVDVEIDDCVLNVNTSSVAATINLQTFTSGLWSTQYKLYVVDTSGNAGTNNITIVAPAGYTINGSSSAVINTNYGSAIVRIVNNTTYQCQLSSFSNSTQPLTFFSAQKLMQAGGTTYVPVHGGSIFSVLSGQAISSYSSPTVQTLAGFNNSTGVWTVAASGYYIVNAKMVTRINSTDLNATVDGGGLGWMTSGVGLASIACIKTANGVDQVVCAEKQAIPVDLVSDINIECTGTVIYLAAGTTVHVKVLNKMSHAIVGIAASAGLPDCYIDFQAIRIG